MAERCAMREAQSTHRLQRFPIRSRRFRLTQTQRGSSQVQVTAPWGANLFCRGLHHGKRPCIPIILAFATCVTTHLLIRVRRRVGLFLPRIRLDVYSFFIIPLHPFFPFFLLIFRHQEMQLTPSSSMGNCVQRNPLLLFIPNFRATHLTY